METWQNATIRFQGQYVEGRKEGQGRYEWPDGSYYEGGFLDSKFDGYGVYYFAESGKIYEGQFQENLFQGRGKLSYPNSSVYLGDFSSNQRDGHGTLVYQNGNKYTGGWKADQMHGVGVWFDSKENTKRQGEWNCGKRKVWCN